MMLPSSTLTNHCTHRTTGHILKQTRKERFVALVTVELPQLKVRGLNQKCMMIIIRIHNGAHCGTALACVDSYLWNWECRTAL